MIETQRKTYQEILHIFRRNLYMALEIALIIVGALIAVVAAVSGIISLWLTIQYFRYNRRENSMGLTGFEIARKILDDHGLENIKVKRTSSVS